MKQVLKRKSQDIMVEECLNNINMNRKKKHRQQIFEGAKNDGEKNIYLAHSQGHVKKKQR